MPGCGRLGGGRKECPSSPVERPPVKGALYHIPCQFSSRERPADMRTTIVDRIVIAIDIRDKNVFPSNWVTLHHPRWNFRRRCNLYPTVCQLIAHSLLASSSQLFLKTCSSNYVEARGSCLQSDSRQDF